MNCDNDFSIVGIIFNYYYDQKEILETNANVFLIP